MSDIEVVVKIPEKTYKRIQALVMSDYFEHDICGDSMRRIAEGTVLSKGHGRIGDLDSIMNDISNSINEMTNIGIMVDGEYLWAKLNDAIDNAQPIIPADTEYENDSERITTVFEEKEQVEIEY